MLPSDTPPLLPMKPDPPPAICCLLVVWLPILLVRVRRFSFEFFFASKLGHVSLSVCMFQQKFRISHFKFRFRIFLFTSVFFFSLCFASIFFFSLRFSLPYFSFQFISHPYFFPASLRFHIFCYEINSGSSFRF